MMELRNECARTADRWHGLEIRRLTPNRAIFDG